MNRIRVSSDFGFVKLQNTWYAYRNGVTYYTVTRYKTMEIDFDRPIPSTPIGQAISVAIKNAHYAP